MRTRHANMIRRGIYLAHDPLFSKYIDYAPRLVREAHDRELINIRCRVARAITESLQTAMIEAEFARIARTIANGADW